MWPRLERGTVLGFTVNTTTGAQVLREGLPMVGIATSGISC